MGLRSWARRKLRQAARRAREAAERAREAAERAREIATYAATDPIGTAADTAATLSDEAAETMDEIANEVEEVVRREGGEIWAKVLVGVTISALIIGIVIGGNIPSSDEEYPVWGQWCGPGYPAEGTYERDDPPPRDEVDAACMAHDLCYDENGYLDCGCDLQIIADLGMAIDLERQSGDYDAANQGELMRAHFIAQSSTMCTVEMGQAVDQFLTNEGLK